MKKNVCHISTVHPANDIRIYHKEVKSLAENGYKVYLIGNYNNKDIKNNIYFIPLPQIKNKFIRVFFKPFIALIKAIKTKSYIYHLHDPELLPIGIILKLMGKKVIFDSHELVYYQIYDKKWLKHHYIQNFFNLFYKKFEKLTVKFFDAIILAETGYTNYFYKNYPKYKNKFYILQNFPIIKKIEKSKPMKINFNKPILIYAGSLSHQRRIDIILKTVEKLDVGLILLGKWNDYNFQQYCYNLPGYKKVIIDKFTTPDEVYSYMKASDIGLVILSKSKNYTTSISTKIFEYMACEIPVVASNFELWKKTFQDRMFYVEPDNINELINIIQKILNNTKNFQNLLKNNKEYVIKNFSWETESKKLIQLYKKILN